MRKVINVQRENSVDAGTCNLCNRPHKISNVVTGETRLGVRFCDKCLNELLEWTNIDLPKTKR